MVHMRSKTFICIYCGNRKPWEMRSEEHFIPKSIYGKFTIRDVCKDCNRRLGTLVDAAFPRYIRFADYLMTGVITANGVATLGDGSQVRGTVKLVEQKTDNRPYSIVEFTDSKGIAVQKSDVKDVKFMAADSDDMKLVAPGIAKVAHASIHYLLNYKDHRFEHRNFVNRPQLEGLRSVFNPDPSRHPGKSYKEVTISAKGHEELVKILEGFKNPEIRRHFILLRQDGKDIVVLIVLLSEYLWTIRIQDYSLPIEVQELQEESLLYELDKLNRKGHVSHGPYAQKYKKVYFHVANPSFGK